MAIMTMPAMIARLLFASAISFTFRPWASRGERQMRFTPGEKHSILPVSKRLNMLLRLGKVISAPARANCVKDAADDLDRIDRSLLRLLQEDGRRTTLDLAERVGLSPTGTSQRVKRLFRDGYHHGGAGRSSTRARSVEQRLSSSRFALDQTAPHVFDGSPRPWRRHPKSWNVTWWSVASTISSRRASRHGRVSDFLQR